MFIQATLALRRRKLLNPMEYKVCEVSRKVQREQTCSRVWWLMNKVNECKVMRRQANVCGLPTR